MKKKFKGNAEIVDYGYMVEAIDSKGNILGSLDVGEEGMSAAEAERVLRHNVRMLGYKIVDDVPRKSKRKLRKVA